MLSAAAIAALSACTAPPAAAAARSWRCRRRPWPAIRWTGTSPTICACPTSPPGTTPVRVGVILPFASATPRPALWPAAMLKAAELALFDGGNRNILLMTADEGATPDLAGAAADANLLAQGAEIIVGPLFGPSVSAVAPIARDRGVPVLAFSTERSVAGNGVYLLSFLPQNEVRAGGALCGRARPSQFRGPGAANALWRCDRGRLQRRGEERRARPSVDVEHFAPNCRRGDGAVRGRSPRATPTRCSSRKAARAARHRAVAGLQRPGSGQGEAAGHGLVGRCQRRHARQTWTAAGSPRPSPMPTTPSTPNISDVYGAPPPQLASLAYDAVSLVALLVAGRALSPLHPARR